MPSQEAYLGWRSSSSPLNEVARPWKSNIGYRDGHFVSGRIPAHTPHGNMRGARCIKRNYHVYPAGLTAIRVLLQMGVMLSTG